MPNLPYSTSGWTTHRQVGVTKFDFPFPDDPSIYTISRTYEGPLSTYAAPTMRAADATYTSHYLVAQTSFEGLDAACVRYTRTWAPIPADRTTYGATGLSRPNLHDVHFGSVYGASFDDGASSWLFFERISISSIASITASSATRSGTITRSGTNPTSVGGANTSVAARTPPVLPSFTIDVTGPTAGTSSFFNTSNATAIQSAFTARGLTGVSVTKTPYRISISWTGAATLNVTSGSPSVSGGSGSAEITSPVIADTATDTRGSFIQTETVSESESQNITETYSVDGSVRRFTTGAAHGASAGDKIAFWKGDRVVALSRVSAVPSSTTLDVPLADVAGKDFAADTLQVDRAGFRVANGLDSVSTRTVTTWRLPGVSSGITTPDQIPLAAVQTAAADWLAAIVAGSLTSVTATAATDQLTKTAHGLLTGYTVFLTALTGGTGLATLTQYFVIKVDADNFKLATTQENAIAGTAIDITADGTGITVIVPTPWPVVETPGLERWLGSDIYARHTISAQMADALDQLIATA